VTYLTYRNITWRTSPKEAFSEPPDCSNLTAIKARGCIPHACNATLQTQLKTELGDNTSICDNASALSPRAPHNLSADTGLIVTPFIPHALHLKVKQVLVVAKQVKLSLYYSRYSALLALKRVLVVAKQVKREQSK